MQKQIAELFAGGDESARRYWGVAKDVFGGRRTAQQIHGVVLLAVAHGKTGAGGRQRKIEGCMEVGELGDRGGVQE